MPATSRSRPIYVPTVSPADTRAPSRDIYAQMGEANITRMMEDFYAELGKSAIRGMFPEDMVAAARKSALFFVGLLGGPPLYQQQHGSPMMRARHMPFEIDDAGRTVWLECFMRVLERAPERYAFPPEHLEGFKAFLRGFSAWMVNAAPAE